MKNKIAITTESAADLSNEIAAEYDIKIIPMNIVIGEEEYKDGIDLSTKELYKKCALYRSTAKTSGVSPYEYNEFFEQFTENGFDVVHVSLSSKISSCFQNALFAVKESENIFIVDSLNLSAGTAMLALEGAKLRDNGRAAKEIASALEKMRTKINTSFILKDTETIYKGGRCTAAERFGANLFSIRPSIDVIGGKLIPGKRYKGKIESARQKYIFDKLKENKPIRAGRCHLNYSALDQNEVDELVSYIKATSLFDEIMVNEAGCCISAHCGKGCMGIIFENA